MDAMQPVATLPPVPTPPPVPTLSPVATPATPAPVATPPVSGSSSLSCTIWDGCEVCDVADGRSCKGKCSRQSLCPFDQRVDTPLTVLRDPNYTNITTIPGGLNITNSNGEVQEIEFGQIYGGIGNLIHLIFLIIFAWVFKRKVMSKLPKINDVYDRNIRERRVGLFDCCHDKDVCCHTFWCLPVVAGKVSDQTKIISYEAGCCLATLATAPALSTLEIFRCCWRVYTVHRYKENMGYEADLCNSFCLGCFCYSCEIGRESMEVDMETGKAPACCCKVKKVATLAGSSSCDDSSSE